MRLALACMVIQSACFREIQAEDRTWSSQKYMELKESVSSGFTSFAEGLAKFGFFYWYQLSNASKPHDEEDVWHQKQCNVAPELVMQRCSCFEMMNMADQWLKHARISGEEYRQLRRRAAKLHHKDKVGGSDEPMKFLTQCCNLLCGDDKCMQPGRLDKPQTEPDREAKQRRLEYIKEMKKLWAICGSRTAKGNDAQSECYREQVQYLNHETFVEGRRSKARDDVRRPRSNAKRGHEEQLMVFLDNSYSMNGGNLEKGKRLLKKLFPRFEKTPTSVHLIGGSQVSAESSVFKERVEGNGGLYEDVHIRATLIWDNCNDLDLWVIEPNGNKVFFAMKISQTGGELDIDRNVGETCDLRPVENIRWQRRNSRPVHGTYAVLVNHFSLDGRAPVRTAFSVEIAVGPEIKQFEGEVASVGATETVFSFSFPGGANFIENERLSKELFPNTVEFTLEDLDRFWQATAWSTHLWQYIFEQLQISSRKTSMTDWEVLIVTDGIDNDSPGSFHGPSGFNEMMNRLHRQGFHPRISVYCIGNEHCTGDTDGIHHYRDLVLVSGGTFTALVDDATSSEDQLLAKFANRFMASHTERKIFATESQNEWLKLVESGAPVANKNEEYTKDLKLVSVDTKDTKKSSLFSDDIRCVAHGSSRKCSL